MKQMTETRCLGRSSMIWRWRLDLQNVDSGIMLYPLCSGQDQILGKAIRLESALLAVNH